MYDIKKDLNIGKKVKIIKPNEISSIYPDGTVLVKPHQPVNTIGIIDKIDYNNSTILVKICDKYTYYQWFHYTQLKEVDGNW